MISSQLDKTYTWDKLEDRWYKHWLDHNYFHADEDSTKEPYTIVIPPPNVTGILTMGHVLNNTIQDVLIRKARMEGKNACWIPGTDHASIATEAKVSSMLEEKGIKKETLSRQEFLDHAWKWKEKFGGIIISQLKKLGCSCDWDRERFTMDESYSNAVISSFKDLYDKGLIYKGHRIVNWCPVSKSAISDEEVIHHEKNSKLWHFRYPVIGSSKFLVVATTRPETIFGDAAVAVNPNDKRYKNLIGKTIELPLVGREIPIIADSHVDPEFGTGCVKVTPAHDPNDFAIGKRNNLEFINIMNEDASLNSSVPKLYQNMPREDARKKVVSDMDSLGALHKVEDYVNKVGYSERGNVPIEFFMSEQWYLKMDELAKPALEAIESGEIKFHPQHWEKTYNHWMKNIKDWCISRQLLWGHQIPVWYHKDDKSKIHVSTKGPDDLQNWTQEKDVLDTWASSWLWAFAVHEWPKEGQNLKTFYPTDALVTGPDIIFFWVARMIMAGYEFLDQAPFKDVYFTSILRDEEGNKFSKSLGNSPDPYQLFEEYGTDAVRFSTLLMAPQGLDVLFSSSRLEIGRNFMNKLWNASRFIHMNLEGDLPSEIDHSSPNIDVSDKWILIRLSETINKVNFCLDSFHFNEAAKAIYEFTWSDFCDWYIEIAKTKFYGKDLHAARASRAVSVKVIKGILKLLHPYSPFITEEIWSFFKNKTDRDLIISSWPKRQLINDEDGALSSMKIIKDLIVSVRMMKSSVNIPPSKKSDLFIRTPDYNQSQIKPFLKIIKSLANIENITIGKDLNKPNNSATAIVDEVELFIPLKGLIDSGKESLRLTKRLNELKGHIKGIKSKLNNKNFVSRAPKNIVSNEKIKLETMSAEFDLVSSNLELLK